MTGNSVMFYNLLYYLLIAEKKKIPAFLFGNRRQNWESSRSLSFDNELTI